jgi:hypothetical protein
MRLLTSASVWIFLLSLTAITAQAQISSGGLPLSFSSEKLQNEVIPLEQMPDFDLEKIRAEDAVKEQHKDIPLRFAYLHEVSFSPNTHGKWVSLENGMDVWRIRIISEGAHSLNFTYRNLNLPVGSKMFVLNPDTRQYIGAFTEKNNKFDGNFSTSPVAGDEMIIELQVPQEMRQNASMTIATVAHDYKGIFKLVAGFGDSGSCNNNVVCSEWNAWDDQIRSVALITTNFGSAICSGALVNNIANDGTPYFLTANHCLGGSPSTWNFVFNYESSTCNTSTNGTFSNSISNASLLASGGSADYALMELSSTPPASFNVFYAGWDATGNIPQEQVGIHHPSGDVKKISLDDGPGSTAFAGGAQTWRVEDWEDGTTEPGSSGSPLFDQNKRIVGQLYGGEAFCGNSINDYYGKFSVTYPNVCQWLAPGCSTTILDGYNPEPDDGGGDTGSGTLVDLGVAEIVEPIGNTCTDEIIPQVLIQNFGDVTITEADIVYSFDGGNDQVLEWTGSLEADQTELITLPTIVVNSGAHNFSVDALNPNGIVDQVPSNNGGESDFTVGSVEFTMEVITDQFGSETTWELRNQLGQLVAEGGPYEDQASPGAYPQPIESVCLTNSCYQLTVFDQSQNGMCCQFGNGSYTFSDSEGNLEFSGSSFGASDVNSDCLNITIPGCTNQVACNYDPDATEDDGSCILIGDSCDDGLPNTSNDTINADCVCEGTEEVLGCTDINACNYDSNAEVDDGSCILIGDPCDDGDATTVGDEINANCVCEGQTVPGCTNSNACNYDPNATVDDGSCLIVGESCDDGDATTVGDEINASCDCEGQTVPGCTNSTACNYDPNATVDDGSCLIVGDTCDDGDATTVGDEINASCNCEGETVPGCTNSTACNYDPNATVDDGSCILIGDSCDDGDPTTVGDEINASCNCEGETVPGCTNSTACNYDPNATVDDGSCILIGDTCDDGDATTVGDEINANCVCEGETVPGCTDSNACNYDPNATVDDGSCLIVGESCDDGDPETVDDTIDENCQCGGNTIPGCTNSNACNYDPNATVDDGSCLIVGESCDDGDATTVGDEINASCECEGETVPGCTNSTACNYDPNATVDDGSCILIGDSCDDGDPTTVGDEINANCECEGQTVPGCTNSTACNYDPNATVDDGSCILIGDSCDDGDPTTVGDEINANCVCEGQTVPGCTNSTACNYDPNATVDDGSCILIGDSCDDGDPTTVGDEINASCECEGETIPGCTNSTACNYDPNATVDDGSCILIGDSCDDGDPTTVGDEINANCVCEGQTVPGCTNSTACNYDPNATVDDGSCILIGDSCDDGDPTTVGDEINASCECEGETIPGCTNSTACNYDPNATVDDGSCLIVGESCDDGSASTVNDVITADCECEGEVIPGCTNVNACNFNPNATVNDGSCLFTGDTCDDGDPETVDDTIDENCQCGGNTIPGCTNSNACNYDPNATVDDGSCLIVGESCDDGSASTVNDVITVDCECEGEVIPGCTNVNACNFNPNATVNDGSCLFTGDTCDDGDPETVDDTIDENCQCGGNTIPGCTDSNACNYDPNATVDDGSCLIVGESCDDGDPTTVGDEINASCDCEGQTVPGCTDSNACNYDPNATVDDGSCLIVGESCDDGSASTVNDVITADCECEGEVIPGCTNVNACNFNPNATVNDGSCLFTGDTCDDGDPETVDDTIDENCQCGGNTIPGCTDSNACNFNPNATVDDGSCILIGDSCDDGDPTTVGDEINASCECEGETVPGCTNSTACNYDPNATVDDGSCLIVGESCDDGSASTVNDVITAACECEGEVIPGCTNVNACNFNPNATVNDGSCLFTGDTCDDGDPETVDDTIDENCQCGGNTIPGCTDSNACNYDPNATVDDGSCLFTGDSCDDGNPETMDDTIDENCLCEGVEIPGCTNVNACNYDPAATLDDGSCELPQEYYVDNDGDGFGNPDSVITTCEQGDLVTDNTDCDDNNLNVYPGAPGLGQGVDNDCSGEVDGEEPLDCYGDLNNDGFITAADILILISNFGCTGVGCVGDLTYDNIVQTDDLIILLGLYGSECNGQ